MLARPIVRRWLTALVPYGWCLRFARWLLGARHAAVAVVDARGEPRALLSDPTCAVLCEVTEVLHVKRAADGADVLLFGSQGAFHIGRLVLEPGWVESLHLNATNATNATNAASAATAAEPAAKAEEPSADARPSDTVAPGSDALDEELAPFRRLLQAGVDMDNVAARARAAGIDPARLASIDTAEEHAGDDTESVEPEAAVQVEAEEAVEPEAAVEVEPEEGPATIQLG